MMRITRLLLTMLLSLFAGVAQADTRAHEKEELARFEHYAGTPVDEFTMFEMWQWQVLGPNQLALWSTIRDAYLITVEKACNNLEWTHGLSVTQAMRQKVSQKFDFVVFANQRCKIEEIRPVDYRRMVKEGAPQASAERKE